MLYSIYRKLIHLQDIERTPSVSADAALDFFGVNLDHGETIMVNLWYREKKYSVELHKRNTRNEYRFFLNRIRDEINYNLDDILIFTNELNGIVLNIVRKNNSSESKSGYSVELSRMGGKYHVLD